MTSCNRFEEEALLVLEQGAPLDEHFRTCPDCVAAHQKYERLKAQLVDLGREDLPSAGWEERVLLKTKRSPWRMPVWIAAAAAAAVGLVWLFPFAPAPTGPRLIVEARSGDHGAMRGPQVHPGDILEIEARTGGSQHASLRVYLNDETLIAACADHPPCRREGDTIRLSVRLAAAGLYQPLLLTSHQPLPVPASDLDSDTAQAVSSGATVTFAETIEVR